MSAGRPPRVYRRIERSCALVGGLLVVTATAALAQNNAPAFEQDVYTSELREDAGVDSKVVVVKAADQNAGDTVTYSITAGDTSQVFRLDPATGAITLEKALNYPQVESYSLTVEASDGTAKDTARVDVTVRARSVSDLIGTTKPMTAVLFSGQDRNSFQVVANPASPDDTIGIINQSGSGNTAGILFAAEAPFAAPRIGGRFVPIGAWFGVNLTSGRGDEVSGVDLAAGLSVSFISRKREAKIRDGAGIGVVASARFLGGVLYGEVASLGPKNETESLEVGDPYPLGQTLPINKDKKIAATFGVGFRF